MVGGSADDARRPKAAPRAGRPPKPPAALRVKVSQRVDPELHSWAAAQIDTGRFKDWAHVLDSALAALKAQEEKRAKK